MIVLKHYFLDELERLETEKEVSIKNPSLSFEDIMLMDDRELLDCVSRNISCQEG